LRAGVAMRKYLFLSIFILSLATCNTLPAADAEELYTACEQIKESYLETSTTAFINDFVLEHSDLRLALDSGRIAFLHPVMLDSQPYVYAAYFEGRGRFEFSPSETDAQERILYNEKKDSVAIDFRKILFAFSTDILDRLQEQMLPYTEMFGKEAVKSVDRSWHRLVKDDNNHYIFQILRNIIEPSAEQFLLINPQESGWSHSYYYIYDPLFAEEIRLLQSTVRGPNFAQYLKTLCSYSCTIRESQEKCGQLAEPQIKAKHYLIDASMNSAGDFECGVSINYEVLKEPAQLLWMLIHEEVEIDSITSPEHPNIRYLRYEKDKNATEMLYMLMDNPMKVGDTFSLNFFYRGQLVTFAEREVNVNLGAAWYPMYVEMNKATYDVTYQIPEYDDLEFVSTGNRVSHDVAAGRAISKWQITDPEYYIMFEFKERE
jgi:hypothetical protein